MPSETSLTSAVQQLHKEGRFLDCILVAGDKRFAAHKMVLAAASPFLKELLENCPGDNAVIIMQDTSPNELAVLLRYLYFGEVNVQKDRLQGVLLIAKRLCIDIRNFKYVKQTPSASKLNPSAMLLQSIKNVLPVNTTTVNIGGSGAAVQAAAPVATHVKIIPITNKKPQKIISQSASTSNPTATESSTESNKRKRVVNFPSRIKIDTNSNNNRSTVQRINFLKQDSIVTNDVARSDPLSEAIVAAEVLDDDDEEISAMEIDILPEPAKRAKKCSKSDEPINCPICHREIRQGRNLRRHLEISHFSKIHQSKEIQEFLIEHDLMTTTETLEDPQVISDDSNEEGTELTEMQSRPLAPVRAQNPNRAIVTSNTSLPLSKGIMFINIKDSLPGSSKK